MRRQGGRRRVVCALTPNMTIQPIASSWARTVSQPSAVRVPSIEGAQGGCQLVCRHDEDTAFPALHGTRGADDEHRYCRSVRVVLSEPGGCSARACQVDGRVASCLRFDRDGDRGSDYARVDVSGAGPVDAVGHAPSFAPVELPEHARNMLLGLCADAVSLGARNCRRARSAHASAAALRPPTTAGAAPWANAVPAPSVNPVAVAPWAIDAYATCRSTSSSPADDPGSVPDPPDGRR